MKGTRKLVYQNIADMCAAVKELSFETHRFQDCLTGVLTSACGVDGQKGLLQLRAVEYINTSPLEWAKEIDEIYELFGPTSFFMRKVGDSANNQMSIESSLLPRCVTDQFPKAGIYQSRLIGGLRRQATGTVSVRLWEWFWIHFVRSFLGLQVDERPTASEEMAQDDFFTSISRNPYLGILHRTITQLASPLKNRLINLLHVYLVDELLFKFRRRDGTIREEEVKYKLKPHYLHLLYLLILTLEPEEEMAKTYYLYLQKIAENYSSTTVLSHNQNIRNLLRVWLTLATRTVSVEQALVGKLKLANDKQGWFRLARCPIDKFEQSLEKLKMGAREHGRASATKEGIVRLLEKTGEWQPTYSMLAVIEQILAYELKMGHEYQRDREEQGGILARAIQRILLALVEETGNKQLVQALQEKFSRRLLQIYGRGVVLNIDEKTLTKAVTSRSNNRSSSQRRSLLNNKTPRTVSVWAHPPQQNEFVLLYELMYWIAEQIDRIIPGQNKSEYPRVNLRIFCNPVAFLLFVVAIIMLVRYI